MTTGSRTEGVRGIGSNGFIRTVGNLTVTGDLVVLGENRALAGTGSFFWEDADANAEYWAFELPTGTSQHVPVLGVGVGLDGVDLGLFNGITQPTMAVIDADRDSFIALDFQADDVARLRTNAATLRFGLGGSDEIIYTTGALAFQQASTIGTSTGVLTIDGDDGIVLQTTGSGGVTIGETVVISDDALFTLGTDSDAAIVLQSAASIADATLTGVIEGTPQTPALAANSLIISNITDDGDILLAVSDGGHSRGVLHLDGNVGQLKLYAPGGNEVMRTYSGGIGFNASQVAGGDVGIHSTSTGDWVLFDVSAEALVFAAATTISTSTGALTLDPTTNVRIGGTADHGTTAGTNALSIFNGTSPVGTLSNGISLYSTSGELYAIDAAGNTTLNSPHDSDGNWIFRSKNTVTGRVLKVHMEKLMQRLDEMLGGGFIEEFIEEV